MSREAEVNRPRASRDEIRRFHAKLMAAASRSSDPRLERIFELVPREAFLPPGPWHIMLNHQYIETPSADPVFLYQDVLVALDAAKGINNGEPFLHAAWIGAAAPKGGDVICHIGAGTGYYTALLSMLTLPNGRVEAFEIDEGLAIRAGRNLIPFDNVTVTAGDATKLPIPTANVIYVNAGLVAPPLAWLHALAPQGRMIFPWRPSAQVGLAMLLTRTRQGFAARPLMPSWFVPCVGASGWDACTKVPGLEQAWSVRSVWPTSDKMPDDTAVAICGHVWFSSTSIG
jgi:protein-L-isoaspartate(D-aspartate) O-methyltransferase